LAAGHAPAVSKALQYPAAQFETDGKVVYTVVEAVPVTFWQEAVANVYGETIIHQKPVAGIVHVAERIVVTSGAAVEVPVTIVA